MFTSSTSLSSGLTIMRRTVVSAAVAMRKTRNCSHLFVAGLVRLETLQLSSLASVARIKTEMILE